MTQSLFVLVIVNVPVIAVGCGPMFPPEKALHFGARKSLKDTDTAVKK